MSDHTEETDSKSPQAKLARAQDALARGAREREEMEAKLAALQAQHDAVCLQNDALVSDNIALEAARIAALNTPTDIGKRPVALVRLVDNVSTRTEMPDGTFENVISQHTVCERGAVLSFDPKKPGRGLTGLIENQHYAYR